MKAAGIHLAISLSIALLAALLVFFVWYPYPYREISGGRELFLLVVAVDVVMGPLMTLAVFNLNKSRKELRRDLAVIAALQLAALSYGLWTVSVARPVHLVFEIDRFRVVHAIDIEPVLLERAPASLQRLPLTGPTLLAIREFKGSQESFDATMAALQGAHLGARADLWQVYAHAKPRVLAAAMPLAQLKKRFPAWAAELDRVAAATAGGNAVYLPIAGRNSFWTAIIHPQTAEVVGFVPLDPY